MTLRIRGVTESGGTKGVPTRYPVHAVPCGTMPQRHDLLPTPGPVPVPVLVAVPLHVTVLTLT